MHRNRLMAAALLFALLLPNAIESQDRPRRWQRSEGATEAPVVVFHSTQSANLPTAQTVGAGELLFEISHRFNPTISTGWDTFWGLDGSVNNRLGLAVGLHDRVMLGLLRSSLQRNFELNLKARFAEGGSESVAWMVGGLGGVAVTPGPLDFGAFDEKSLQYFAQGIVDVAFDGRLALGLVPSVLQNRNPGDQDQEFTAALGTHAQYYFSEMFSVLGEWLFVEENADALIGADAGSLGIELETGGHFFKFIVTNQVRPNTGQYLAGAGDSFHPDNWRLGFNITRILAF